jgi:hypothetical protein
MEDVLFNENEWDTTPVVAETENISYSENAEEEELDSKQEEVKELSTIGQPATADTQTANTQTADTQPADTQTASAQTNDVIPETVSTSQDTIAQQQKVVNREETADSTRSTGSNPAAPCAGMACGSCSYVGRSLRGLHNHMTRQHWPRAPATCPHCPYTTPDASRLRVHVESLHEKRRHTCDECGASLASVGNLRVHQRFVHGVHSRARRFLCDQCDYSTNQLSMLKRHTLAMHINPKEKRGRGAAALLDVLQHEKKLAHACEDCDYSTPFAGALVRHRAAEHVGVRHICAQCDYWSKFKFALNKHVKVVHEGFRFRCTQCAYECRSARALRHHHKKAHGIES